jgi:hypothetical protein
MDDPIAIYYSQPHQTGGSYRKMGSKTNSAIPIKTPSSVPYLEKENGDKAKRNSEDYGRLASQARHAQKLRRQPLSDSDDSSDNESKRVINRKKKKSKKYKRSDSKRSRIDEALGSDTY